MRSTYIRAYVVIVVFLGSILATAVAFPRQVTAVSNQTIVNLLNQERRIKGAAPFAYNARLSSSAYAKARDMCQNDYWAHTSPTGVTPWYFIDNAGYNYVTAAENLANGFSSDSGVVKGWMNSAGHRQNILSTKFNDVGVGNMQCNFMGKQTTVVVAHFGSTGARSTTKAVQKKKTTTAPKPQPKPVTQQPVQSGTLPTKRPTAKPAQETATKKQSAKPVEKTVRKQQAEQKEQRKAQDSYDWLTALKFSHGIVWFIEGVPTA